MKNKCSYFFMLLLLALVAMANYAFAEVPLKNSFIFDNMLEENSDIIERLDVVVGGNVVVLTKDVDSFVNEEFLKTLPDSLQDIRIKNAIENRREINVFEHNPVLSAGKKNPPITMIEFSDLSCLQCYKTLQDVDKIREKYSSDIRYVHIHLPVDMYNSTNPAAFYGRLAYEQGVFWEYRKALFNINEVSENAFVEKLVEVGVDIKHLRRIVRKNARRYYRELDADAELARSLGENRPPVFYVNGIKVGSVVSVDKLDDLIQYEIELRKQIDLKKR